MSNNLESLSQTSYLSLARNLVGCDDWSVVCILRSTVNTISNGLNHSSCCGLEVTFMNFLDFAFTHSLLAK